MKARLSHHLSELLQVSQKQWLHEWLYSRHGPSSCVEESERKETGMSSRQDTASLISCDIPACALLAMGKVLDNFFDPGMVLL